MAYTKADCLAMLTVFLNETFSSTTFLSSTEAETILAVAMMDTARAALPGDLKSALERDLITLVVGQSTYPYGTGVKPLRLVTATFTYDNGATYPVGRPADADDLCEWTYNPWTQPSKKFPRYMPHYGETPGGGPPTEQDLLHIWPTPVFGDVGNIALDYVKFEKTLTDSAGILASTLPPMGIPRAAALLALKMDDYDKFKVCDGIWKDTMTFAAGGRPRFYDWEQHVTLGASEV
jgi:hypothetical protein